MKKLIVGFVWCIALGFSAFAADEKIVRSEINNVTVYSQGAQIFRSANYSVGKGVTEIVIEGVSRYIDPNSLQVKATGNVILLDSKYSLYYPKPEDIKLDQISPALRKSLQLLEDSLQNISYELQEINDEISVLNSARSILQNNGAIRGQGKVNDSIALLKEAIDYYTTKMSEINKKLQALQKKRQAKEKTQQGMQDRYIALENHANNNQPPKQIGPSHRITVTVSCEDFAKGKLDVSYLVSQAGWVPLYDLRSDIATGKVNLNYKAQVYQNTGIDWENVKLSISTNNPYQNKTKPELHPWYIDYYSQNYGRVEYKKNESNKLREKAAALNYDAAPTTTLSGGVAEYEEAILSTEFVQVMDHVISAEFKIDLPYTIKSNNEQHMVLVKNEDLSAEFKYYAVPKYDKGAYLVAQISKLDELQLVPAKANIFFDGSYIGETYLDPTSMDDTLNLSLGKDPNIIIKRTLLERECKEKVIGTKNERSFAYSIEVKNLKSKSIEIIIQDQIPVTQNADIEIEANELSKGDYNQRTGIIEWKVSLKPGASKDILLKYTVKHDKDKNLSIPL